MDLNEQTTKRPMTPEEVLSVFRGLERLDVMRAPSEPIQFDTTIFDFYLRIDSTSVPFNVGASTWEWVTQVFDVSIPYRTWKAVVRPKNKPTVRDLCELIASEAVVEDVQPLSILGRECLPAGAFLAVRNMLADEGVDVSDLRPSTPLEPLLKQNPTLFQRMMIMLVPGRLPRLRTKMHRFQLAACCLSYISVLLMAIAIPMTFHGMNGPTLLLLTGMVGIALSLVSLYATRSLPPREATLGEMQTVRDLCYAIVKDK